MVRSCSRVLSASWNDADGVGHGRRCRLLGGGRRRAAEANHGQEHRDEEALFHTHQYGNGREKVNGARLGRWPNGAGTCPCSGRTPGPTSSPSPTRRAAPSRFSCAWITWPRNRPRFLWAAFILLPAALVFDVLDGYVARLDKKRQSVLGADLDSLADVISFGVAPAVLGFTLGLRGGWDMADPDLLRGVRRQPSGAVQRRPPSALADETTGKVKYFEGTPIPTSVLLVIILGVAQ